MIEDGLQEESLEEFTEEEKIEIEFLNKQLEEDTAYYKNSNYNFLELIKETNIMTEVEAFKKKNKTFMHRFLKAIGL